MPCFNKNVVGFNVAAALGQVWFSYVDPSSRNINLIANGAGVCIIFMHCYLYVGQGVINFARKFIFGVMLTRVTLITGFVIALIIDFPFGTLLSPTHIFIIYIIVYNCTILLLVVATILMATDAVCAEFEQLSALDPMTGALKREAILQLCNRELAHHKRHGRTMALMMVDLDKFKTINDSYGHMAGDLVLVDFVQCTQAQLRSFDRIGRYGGEEFVVLLPETDLQGAAVVAERIRTQVAEPHGTQPDYTVSIGIASTELGDDTVETLIARADQAMYRAKAQGRNRTVWRHTLVAQPG